MTFLHSVFIALRGQRGQTPLPFIQNTVGNLFGTPLVRCVRDLNPILRCCINVDDVHSGAVAGNDAAAPECVDGSGADRGVLGDHPVRVASLFDNFVFVLPLRRHELEPGSLEDPALDVHRCRVFPLISE
jgi:hypothetical protein